VSRVKDKLIRLQKEYASYGEYDGIYAKDVQEMIDELLDDLNEDEKPQKILYQQQAYGTPYTCPSCGADQIKTEFYNSDGSEPKEKNTYCWKCRQKLDWSTNV
jgi:predicted SprT family Zn-dependent metalloprotease